MMVHCYAATKDIECCRQIQLKAEAVIQQQIYAPLLSNAAYPVAK